LPDVILSDEQSSTNGGMMANQSGKRYVCGSCGSEMLVTRAGDGQLECCGQPMRLRGTSPTSAAGETTTSGKQEVSRGESAG
jgi:desulfoferrodoxin-like iron-binding protein